MSLFEQKEAVSRLLDSPSLDIRGPAVAAYALLAGKSSVGALRKRLQDPHPGVRTMAIAALAHYRDNAAVPGICVAVKGIQDGPQSITVIKALEGWRNLDLVPAIIRFLQNDDSKYRYGDDLGVPAIHAKRALKTLTGCWFPFEVQRSLAAWNQARRFTDPRQRQQFLTHTLRANPLPVEAVLARSGAVFSIVVRNHSTQSLYLQRQPSIDTLFGSAGNGSSGSSYSSGEHPVGRQSFVRLKPGQRTVLSLRHDHQETIAQFPRRRVRLFYGRNGHEWDLNAWMGTLLVKIPSALEHPSAAGDRFREALEKRDLRRVTQFLRRSPRLVNARLNPPLEGGFSSPPDYAYPLWIAVEKRDEALSRLLLRRGANPEVKDRQETPLLHRAVTLGSPNLVRLLLKRARVDSRDSQGRTALMNAKDATIARLLLDRGAQVNARESNGYTPLHLSSNGAVTALLLARGANPNTRGAGNSTPLINAPDEESTRLLLAGGASATARDSYGCSALHSAAGKRGSDRIGALLIAAGAKVTTVDDDGDTPLHQAALEGDTALARVLLQHHAPPNVPNRAGMTPLDLALILQPGRTALIEELRKHGAQDRFLRQHGGLQQVLEDYRKKERTLVEKHGPNQIEEHLSLIENQVRYILGRSPLLRTHPGEHE